MRNEILICLFFVVVTIPAILSQQKLKEVKVSQGIKAYAKTHPNAKIIQMKKNVIRVARSVHGSKLRFSIGHRGSNDDIIATAERNYIFPDPQNSKFKIGYPHAQSAQGKTVTYIEITLEQSSLNAQAYVIDGGIGQKSVRVMFEVKDTTFLKYKAVFYGH